MSFTIIPLGPLFDGHHFGHDWQMHDPIRNEHFKGMKSHTGTDMTQPMAPLLAMDIIEDEKEYRAISDLPGVSPDDLDLTVENQSITIKAERKHQLDTDKDKVHRLERSYGSVSRRILLPKNADMSLARTHFSNGVLTITVPKHVEMPITTRKLEIHSE